jgi:adenosine kinase
LLHFVAQADYVTTNDYEAQLLQDKTGKKVEELSKGKRAFIITRGGEGSTIYAGGKEIAIPCAKPEALRDPTGCGDAYRAGLLYGIRQGWDWETTGRLASLLGTIKIASRGGQNHAPTRDELKARYRQHFGHDISL